MSNQRAVVDRLRRAFNAGKSLPVEFRKAQLRNLLRLYDEGETEVKHKLILLRQASICFGLT